MESPAASSAAYSCFGNFPIPHSQAQRQQNQSTAIENHIVPYESHEDRLPIPQSQAQRQQNRSTAIENHGARLRRDEGSPSGGHLPWAAEQRVHTENQIVPYEPREERLVPYRSHRGHRRLPRQDRRDAGNLPEHLVGLSCEMANLLRHKGYKYGLRFDADGFVRFSDLLNIRKRALREASIDDIETVVEESFSKARPRFEIMEVEGERYIRATHKHSEVFVQDRPLMIEDQVRPGHAARRCFVPVVTHAQEHTTRRVPALHDGPRHPKPTPPPLPEGLRRPPTTASSSSAHIAMPTPLPPPLPPPVASRRPSPPPPPPPPPDRVETAVQCSIMNDADHSELCLEQGCQDQPRVSSSALEGTDQSELSCEQGWKAYQDQPGVWWFSYNEEVEWFMEDQAAEAGWKMFEDGDSGRLWWWHEGSGRSFFDPRANLGPDPAVSAPSASPDPRNLPDVGIPSDIGRHSRDVPQDYSGAGLGDDNGPEDDVDNFTC